MTEIEPTPENIRNAALGLLGRREHGRLELRRKLQRRFGAVAALDAVLDTLEQDGYLSDRRFAGSVTRMRSVRGYGPLRVRAELTAKGVAKATAAHALEEHATDWVALATQALRKRFGSSDSSVDLALRGKQYRFLAQRGFSADQIRAALDAYGASAQDEDADRHEDIDEAVDDEAVDNSAGEAESP